MKNNFQSLDLALLPSDTLKSLAELVRKREAIDSEIESLLVKQKPLRMSGAVGATLGFMAKDGGRPSRYRIGTRRRSANAAALQTAGRGELSHMIVNVIRDSGDAGISVPEIARATGRTLSNIHNWMSSTAKNLDPREFGKIEKIAPGRYRTASEPTDPEWAASRRG